MDLEGRNFIKRSSSPSREAAVFVKVLDGSLRMCIDHRKLNERTVIKVPFLEDR